MRLATVLLALPFAVLFTLLAILHVEPPLGPLGPVVAGEPGRHPVIGSLIVLGLWSLALASAGIQIRRIVRIARSGASLGTMRLDLAIAAATLAFVAALPVGIAVDQYPCWVGVPNCD